MAKVLLKARPTAAQVADRLAEPVPDGIEFYLDRADILGDDWLAPLADIATAGPANLEYVVEGPLRSLDGAFFDATLPNAANLAVIDRLTAFGARIRARAAVIHAMAARPAADGFDAAAKDAALKAALPLFRYYAAKCESAGLIATVENVPPVARMREGSFMYSLIGTAPADIAYLVERVPGLRVTIDVSHAQLYVNAFDHSLAAPAALAPMVSFLRCQPGVCSVSQYVDALAGHLAEAHLSNARGLLGEGLPYDDGELDLDSVVAHLSLHVSFLVTETIEPDPARAIHMREAQRRIAVVLDRMEQA